MVVLVRDATVGWVLLTAEIIRKSGCAVGLVSTPLSQADAAALDGAVHGVAIVDGAADARQIADAALQLSRHHELGALLSLVDSAVVAAAEAAALAGVGRSPADGLARARNKYAARCAMRDAGLPTPGFGLISDPAQAEAVAREVGLPAVVKPVNGTGSHLVVQVDTVPELAETYHTLATRLLDAPHLRNLYARPLDGGLDPQTTFLVEGRLQGREFCLDVIVRDGQVEQLPLVDKFLIDERFFELGFVCPPLDLEPDLADGIAGCVDDAVLALGLDNTVACIEVIDDELMGPTVVEVNAGRPGGQLVGLVYELCTGVSTTAELVGLARGVPAARVEPLVSVPLATFTLFPGQTGRLRAVHGLEEVAELPEVVRVVPAVSPGDLISDDFEIWAVNLLVAGLTDYQELTDFYAEASSLVRFDIEPLS